MFPAPFPVAELAEVRAGGLPPETSAALDAVLEDATRTGGRGGFTAVVLDAASGSWAGAAGTADGTNAMTPDHAMYVGAITQTVIAAQVMQLVERGQVDLDAPVADYLPSDIPFDLNGASVRHLLGMRSGIPDHLAVPGISIVLREDRLRRWTRPEVLALVPDRRGPTGEQVALSTTNYVLLGLLIEHVTGTSLSRALRAGVLDHPGLERVVVQPDEAPTAPVALLFGSGVEPGDVLAAGGGFLPSASEVTASVGAGNLAGDAPAVARWWQLLCGGHVVSRTSLTEMADFQPRRDVGLGLTRFNAPGGTPGVGAFSFGAGFAAVAACLPVDGVVVVLMTNHNAQYGLYEVFDAILAEVLGRE
ncbi:serine hydrolase [Georgenia sp. M64]|uniref:serine hydrolase domain-containing protein n=1 Tax=Georgenia sp. M64 TaxID=3120520 RepID=UPI0030E19148